MKKIRTCVVVVFLLISLLIIQPVKASSNYWWAAWLDYQHNVDFEGVHRPITNLSTATTVYSSDQSQWVKIALVVSVYDYEPYVNDDRVVFRVALYYDSFADETMLPVPAYTVTLIVEKDLYGSNFNDHRMKVETSGDDPGYAQGDGLDQTSYIDSTQNNREWWALKALQYGAGLFIENLGVVTGLISLANSFVPQPTVDYMDAGYSDYGLYSWWHDPGYDFGLENPVRQYAFNTIEWIQHPVNPSDFFGIKVWARIVLHTEHSLISPVIDTAPVYLRIHRSHALSISVTSGGNTEPYPGTYHFTEGKSVSVTAFAYSGYYFNYWSLDGATVYCNPITVTMDADHSLKAHFNKPPNTPSTPLGPNSGYKGTSYTYTASATDLDGDSLKYEFDWNDSSTTWTDWYTSDATASASHSWSSRGTYYVKVRAQDSFGALSDWSQSLTVNIVNRAPNKPSTPSDPNSGYVYTSYCYSTSTTDPDGDNVRYEFDWNDGTYGTTGYYASGTVVSMTHSWTRPGTYAIKTRAQDTYNAYSTWSTAKTVTITQNDADSGGDAGNSSSTALSITPMYTSGTLYQASPVDTCDWYKFNVEQDHMITIEMTPPQGVNFDIQLYNPNNTLKSGSYLGPGQTDHISFISTSSGNWTVKVYIVSGEGLYTLCVSVAYGGGTCPTLFVWNGSTYADYGVINIHNPTGEDIIKETPVNAQDVSINNYQAIFRLREGWPGLNFSESFIDQVKLYAVDTSGNRYLCPLIEATHSRLGNVLPQLLFSDNWKTQTLLLETINLKFLMPYPRSLIQSYIFTIEGCNPFKD